MKNLYSSKPAEFIVSRVREVPAMKEAGDSPEAIFKFWKENIESDPRFEPDKERLVVFILNTKFKIIGFHTVSIGSLNESIAHPREIFKPVIVASGYGFVAAHNHPSSEVDPSQADCHLTRRIREGAELLGLRFLDHVIIGENKYYSFREAGII